MAKYDIGPRAALLAPGVLQQLQKLETASLGHFRNDGFPDNGIKPLKQGMKAVGTAYTVSIPAQDSTLLHHALSGVRPGDFLVIDRCGDYRHACWGGGVTLAAKLAGATGAIIDGACTDPLEIQSLDFPIWCRGISPLTTRLADLGGSMNRPVTIGGVIIHPGDAIIADESGIAVLPAADAGMLIERGLALQNRASLGLARIQAGESLGDIYGATLLVLKDQV